MKKLISLREASFFLMTLSLIMSCSKKEGTTPPPIINPPTGGGGGTPTPAPTPIISWAVSGNDAHRTDRAFKDEVKSLSISVQYADSSRIMGTNTTTVQTGAITSPMSYTAIAWYDKGNSVISPKSISLYGSDTSLLCWNVATQLYGKWTNTTAASTTDSINWYPVALDLVKWVYYPDGSRQGISGGAFTSYYQISFIGADMYINLGNPGTLNKFKVEVLTENTLVLSRLEAGKFLLVTYSKS